MTRTIFIATATNFNFLTIFWSPNKPIYLVSRKSWVGRILKKLFRFKGTVRRLFYPAVYPNYRYPKKPRWLLSTNDKNPWKLLYNYPSTPATNRPKRTDKSERKTFFAKISRYTDGRSTVIEWVNIQRSTNSNPLEASEMEEPRTGPNRGIRFSKQIKRFSLKDRNDIRTSVRYPSRNAHRFWFTQTRHYRCVHPDPLWKKERERTISSNKGGVWGKMNGSLPRLVCARSPVSGDLNSFSKRILSIQCTR